MRKRDVQIKIMVTPEEDAQIQKNAKACDKTVSAYVREMALDMCVYQYNYRAVQEHTAQLSLINKAVIQLLFTIRRLGSYAPADLEYMMNKVHEMQLLEKEFLQYDIKIHEDLRKQIADTVREIVDTHLANENDK